MPRRVSTTQLHEVHRNSLVRREILVTLRTYVQHSVCNPQEKITLSEACRLLWDQDGRLEAVFIPRGNNIVVCLLYRYAAGHISETELETPQKTRLGRWLQKIVKQLKGGRKATDLFLPEAFVDERPRNQPPVVVASGDGYAAYSIHQPIFMFAKNQLGDMKE